MGLWALRQGLNKLDDLPEEAADQLVFLGRFENPVGFLKRGEINELFTDLFYQALELWHAFKGGYGYPFHNWIDGPYVLKQYFDALDEVK